MFQCFRDFDLTPGAVIETVVVELCTTKPENPESRTGKFTNLFSIIYSGQMPVSPHWKTKDTILHSAGKALRCSAALASVSFCISAAHTAESWPQKEGKLLQDSRPFYVETTWAPHVVTKHWSLFVLICQQSRSWEYRPTETVAQAGNYFKPEPMTPEYMALLFSCLHRRTSHLDIMTTVLM